MAITIRTCFVILSIINVVCSELTTVPTVTIQALKPKGLRVFLPGDSKLTFFFFEAEIYNAQPTGNSKKDKKLGEIWGYGENQTYGWVYENPGIALDIGQFLVYKVFISHGNGASGTSGPTNFTINGLASSHIVHEIKELEDPLAFGRHCPATVTKLRGGRACAKQVIFEDNFDTFREDLWQIEQYIPIDHPEHPFVSYQRLPSNPTVMVKNGALQIVPKLQQELLAPLNQSILSGTLDLTGGCTERVCTVQGVGVNIIPPIVSGRVTSARFAFTYGEIHVRAKVPQGDWIYPEILLEPLSKKYGSMNYASGVLKIAMVRGNVDINNDRFGNKALVGGPIINAKCRSALEFYHKTISTGFWGDDFHDYMVQWTPDEIVLYVDGENWGRYEPGADGLRSWLPASCQGPWYELLTTGTPMAPFDDHFYITLGVAAGGISEFPDGLVTGSGHEKPWRNKGRKAALNFWQSQASWYPTWTSPGLIIDSIKVTAL